VGFRLHVLIEIRRRHTINAMRGLLLWPLLAAHALAWKHVSEDALRTSLKESEYTLIACESNSSLEYGCRMPKTDTEHSCSCMHTSLTSINNIELTMTQPESEAGKALEPEWKVLQDTSSDPDIVSFDCSENMIVCQEFDIASYPAIRLYRRDGGMHRHRGERTPSEMLAFLRRARRTPVIEVDATLVSTLLDVDNIVFLAHIGPRDKDLRDQFKALAARYRDSYSFIMTGPLQGKSALHCINNIDKEEHTTVPFSTVGGLEAFVKRCSSPLMPELTRANEAEYTGVSPLPLNDFQSIKEFASNNSIPPQRREKAFSTTSSPLPPKRKSTGPKCGHWPRNTPSSYTSP